MIQRLIDQKIVSLELIVFINKILSLKIHFIDIYISNETRFNGSTDKIYVMTHFTLMRFYIDEIVNF